jgi:hypothetical protein
MTPSMEFVLYRTPLGVYPLFVLTGIVRYAISRTVATPSALSLTLKGTDSVVAIGVRL